MTQAIRLSEDFHHRSPTHSGYSVRYRLDWRVTIPYCAACKSKSELFCDAVYFGTFAIEHEDPTVSPPGSSSPVSGKLTWMELEFINAEVAGRLEKEGLVSGRVDRVVPWRQDLFKGFFPRNPASLPFVDATGGLVGRGNPAYFRDDS